MYTYNIIYYIIYPHYSVIVTLLAYKGTGNTLENCRRLVHGTKMDETVHKKERD